MRISARRSAIAFLLGCIFLTTTLHASTTRYRQAYASTSPTEEVPSSFLVTQFSPSLELRMNGFVFGVFADNRIIYSIAEENSSDETILRTCQFSQEYIAELLNELCTIANACSSLSEHDYRMLSMSWQAFTLIKEGCDFQLMTTHAERIDDVYHDGLTFRLIPLSETIESVTPPATQDWKDFAQIYKFIQDRVLEIIEEAEQSGNATVYTGEVKLRWVEVEE